MRKFIVLVVFLLGFDLYSQDNNDDLIVHYEFDGDFEDSTDNNFHSDNQGSIFAEDRFGNLNSAVFFNGIDGYINLPNEQDLKPQMPFSISFWIKYSSTSFDDQEVFELSYEENRNSGVYFNSQANSGKMAINIANGSYNYVAQARRSYVSNNVIEIDNWLNVVAVVNSPNDMKIYYDCKGIGGQFSGFANSLVYSDNNGVIGKRQRNLNANPNYFYGYLDDFKIWSRALGYDEVLDICDDNLSSVTFENRQETVIIYPNPSYGYLQFKSTYEFEKIEVLNQIGKKVFSQKYSQQINISHLSSGVYFIKFIGADISDIQKIILN